MRSSSGAVRFGVRALTCLTRRRASELARSPAPETVKCRGVRLVHGEHATASRLLNGKTRMSQASSSKASQEPASTREELLAQNNDKVESSESFNVLRAPLEPFDYDQLVREYEAGIAQDEQDLDGQSTLSFAPLGRIGVDNGLSDALAELDRVVTSYRASLVRQAFAKRVEDEGKLREDRQKLVARDEDISTCPLGSRVFGRRRADSRSDV